MAQVDIGKIKIVWKGPWNSGTAYTVDDAVSHSGNSYICIQAGTNQNPSTATAYWQIMASAGTNGTDADLLNIASTAQGDIYYNNGSAIARLAPGTASQVLQTGGAGANPSWGTMSSDFVKLGQANVSNAAEAVFDGLFSSDYKIYKIHGYGIYSNVTNNDLQFRVNVSGSQNSDSVYNNVNWYVYTDTTPSHNIGTQGSGSNDMNAPSSAWSIDVDSFTDASNRPSFFEMTLADPQQASAYKMAEWHHWYHGRNADIMQSGNGHGVWKSLNAITGIRIQGSGGNITGNFTLYGIKN